MVAVISGLPDPVLQATKELGFDSHSLTWEELLSIPHRELINQFSAIICEDYEIPHERAVSVLKNYVGRLGGLLLVYKSEIGAVSKPAEELLDICGLELREISPGVVLQPGPWVVPEDSPLRSYFDDGVFYENEIGIFGCPPLVDDYRPVVPRGCTVLAWSRGIPRITSLAYPSGGIALYANSAFRLNLIAGNHVLVKPVIRYALSECARLPRLVPAPDGVSGLVLNMHVCSSAYFPDLRRLLFHRAFDTDLPMSIHVTAGPDLNYPGDGLGVDIANAFKGRGLILALSRFGTLGAHGGWIHNYWAYNFNVLPLSIKRAYLAMNIESLAKLSHKPVKEYSAPGGVHDCALDDFLASKGVRATIYPFAMHSAPTQRREGLWHFGYTGTRYGLCFENMIGSGCSDQDIRRSLDALLRSIVRLREIRLVYFHPRSLAEKPQLWREFRDKLERLRSEGQLQVATAASFAEWLDRFKAVGFHCFSNPHGTCVEIESKHSLKSVTVEIPDPNHQLAIPLIIPEGVSIYRVDDCIQIRVDDDCNSLYVMLRRKVNRESQA
ncbi:MAG TPA: hypothetical protein GXX40_10040 [Firmicutes bacterium]|nr:hypothetical protein [Bacillota bacterium]